MLTDSDRYRARRALAGLFEAAVAAVNAETLVARALSGRLPAAHEAARSIALARRVLLLAIGKASVPMARAAEAHVGARLIAGLVVTPKGSPARGALISRIVEASHPLPDESSELAARLALELLQAADADDVVIVALSGGASALFALPAPGVTLAHKIQISSALLRAGASIRELNTVRKHLSAVKGGRLLEHVREARLASLILSDVPGNDLATIGSGLTAPDPTTFADAVAVLKRRGVWGRAPEPVRDHFERGAAGEIEETLKPGNPEFARVTNAIIGDNATAVAALEAAVCEAGYAADHWRELHGEADDVGRALAAHMAALRSPRTCVVAGGEPVVTVRGAGKGGRAQQCALAFASELARIAPDARIAALFASTDGIDGPTDAAGAFAFADTVARAAASGFNASAALARNDAYNLFLPIGDLFLTGPTATNVADLFIGLLDW
jgi:glycerate-2-kinase